MIRALIFDFDGLILDTETPLVRAWARLHEEHGLVYDPSHAHAAIGHVDVPFDPWTAFPRDVDRQALKVNHRRINHELLALQVVRPGVVDYLEAARERGLSVAVASNSDHAWVEGHLERLGLRDRFRAFCCREDVAKGKPEPDVYLKAMDRLGVKSSEAIAFEDSLPGSTAAKRAGLFCVAVPNESTRHQPFDHVDLRLGSLAEMSLANLLDRVERGSRVSPGSPI
jgi:HAD superfamily hydrolase (TIGR01509 family)